MTKTYLQDKGRKKNRKAKVWAYLLIAVIVSGVYLDSVRWALVKTVSTVSYPFVFAGKTVSSKLGFVSYPFKSKGEMLREIEYLESRNAELESQLLLAETFREENEELKSFLGQTNNREYILGSVVFRPPQSPYDVIIVDAGSENGVAVGMRAVAYSNIMVGSVAEVLPKTSKIRLISFTGQETGVLIGDSGVPATAAGIGGGNMEIRIPSSVSASTSDKIITGGSFPLLVGAAEKIEADDLSPFKRILFRVPVNLNEIKSIMLEK
ncbi:MAG: rod shape-determining protein MreC [Candidatus Pacebacteria bacterium]|nr:rod shape-determining protein MreC [Candidatus Paceibacterota bacterium]NUQ57628.1 rod shape-determining protein MreC [Candidatus Paceibacter sp.]